MTINWIYSIIHTVDESNELLDNKTKKSENSKKFLTNKQRHGIIHTVRNEASNKVSKVLKKKFEKTSKKFLTNASKYAIIHTVKRNKKLLGYTTNKVI